MKQLTMAHETTGSFSQGVATQQFDVDGTPLASNHKRTYQACVSRHTPGCEQKAELTKTRSHVGAGKCAVT